MHIECINKTNANISKAIILMKSNFDLNKKKNPTQTFK